MGEDKNIICYSSSGGITLKGFVKNGLDSSVLINTIVVYDSMFENFKKKGFGFPPNLFHYHEISHPETMGVLINKHNFTKDEAKEAFKKLIAKFNLTKISKDFQKDNTYQKLVQEANTRVMQKYNDKKLEIGNEDIVIIGGFLREKVNFVHTGDKGFLKTCEELDFSTMPISKEDIAKEEEIKRLMKFRNKTNTG